MQSRGCARARSVASAPSRVDVEGDVSGAGPFLGPIFKGPKKGGLYSNLFVRGGGVCLLARTNVVGAARCFTSRCVLTSALSSLSFFPATTTHNNTEPFFDLCKILQDETRKNRAAQQSGPNHGEDERSIRLSVTGPRGELHRDFNHIAKIDLHHDKENNTIVAAMYFPTTKITSALAACSHQQYVRRRFVWIRVQDESGVRALSD